MERRYRLLGVRYLFCALCALCLALLLKLPAAAEEYTYTVRFFAGKQGSIHTGSTLNVLRMDASGRYVPAQIQGEDPDGTGQVLVFEGLQFGDRVNFERSMVSLNNGSKYYIRGIRESGKDNNTVEVNPSISVDGDLDYVVAYGILGDAVKYTINYVDEAGNALMPSEEYYGNVGDRVVVAYLYIDGYRPQAYNVGRTLVDDPSQNVINFVYSQITNEVIVIPGQPAPEVPGAEGGGTTIIDQGVINEGGTNFDDQNPGGGDNPGGVNPGGEGNQGENEDIGDNPTPGADEPNEYEDQDEIEDNDTPLSGLIQGDGSEEDPLRIEIGALTIPLSTNLIIGVISVFAIIIGLSLLLTEILRRKNDE